MGRNTFSRTTYQGAVDSLTAKGKPATVRGEEQVRTTGKLHKLVDPAEYGVIRPSRIRLEERKDGLFEVSVGAPVTIEYRLDTTGSMGDNVDRALAALPDICGLVSGVVPGRDPFYCASIFGDLDDILDDRSPGFPLCRGQFEVLADRMVNQLTLMHPGRQGCANGGEDPHYGLFGAAYLTDAYIQKIGLRSYDFTVTDEPAHEGLVSQELKRIFGPSVFDRVRENGYELNLRDLPSNKDIVKDLFRRAHAFALLVRGSYGNSLAGYWQPLYGKDRVIFLPQIEHVPHVMAAIVGLTEGTLDLRSAVDFLMKNNLSRREAQSVVDAVAHIPLGAQRALPNFDRMPKKGDVFLKKTDLWPVNSEDVPQSDPSIEEPTEDPTSWL